MDWRKSSVQAALRLLLERGRDAAKMKILGLSPRLLLSLEGDSRREVLGMLLRRGRFDLFTPEVLAGLSSGEVVRALAAAPDQPVEDKNNFVVFCAKNPGRGPLSWWWSLVELEGDLIETLEDQDDYPHPYVLSLEKRGVRQYATEKDVAELRTTYPGESAPDAEYRREKADEIWALLPAIREGDDFSALIGFADGVSLSRVLGDVFGCFARAAYGTDFSSTTRFVLDTIGQFESGGEAVTRVRYTAEPRED